MDGRATKVFKRRPNIPDEHTQAVYSSEIEAYKIASENASLQSLIPRFFGPISISQIVDSFGADITGQFFVDLAYQMSRVNGIFVKLATLPSEQRRAIDQLFNSFGILYTSDASVIVESSQVVCVIDFAVNEHELFHQPL